MPKFFYGIILAILLFLLFFFFKGPETDSPESTEELLTEILAEMRRKKE